ncbi:hypothetical protein [Trichothermofontia sp.]
MTTTEPTLRDIADKLEQVELKLDYLEAGQTPFTERVTNDLQATQWVVRLALALIALATVTVVVSSALAQ